MCIDWYNHSKPTNTHIRKRSIPPRLQQLVWAFELVRRRSVLFCSLNNSMKITKYQLSKWKLKAKHTTTPWQWQSARACPLAGMQKKQLKQIMCKSQNPAVQWYVAYSNFLWFTRFTTQTQTQRTKQKQNEQFKFRCFFSCETNIFVAALLPWKSTTNKKTRAFFAFRYSYFYARLFIIVLTSWCCCCRFFVVLVCFDVCV